MSRILTLLLSLLTTAALAQFEVGDLGVYTVGTSTQVSGTHWAYLLWQPTQAGALDGQAFAIYRKAGPASSANAYSRQSITRLQTSSSLLTPLVGRAQKLGDDLVSLNMTLADMHQDLADSLSLEDKLSSVLREATSNAKSQARLYVLGRTHPSVALAMGNAYAAALPAAGTYTFEIRVWDTATAADKFVLGRVTISTPASSLPSASSLYAFSESNEKGHLNMKLRWATPDPLRMRALEHYGYNIYRLTKAEAESRGWHSTPPTPAALLSAVGGNLNPAIQRINHFPVLPSKRLDAAAATLVTDTETAFFTDDNKRFSTSAPRAPLLDGAEYYYFVTARDILNRDGLVSNPVLARISDRFPPRAPQGVKVTNEFANVGGTRKQFLRIHWEASPAETDGAGIVGYRVYRYNSDRDIPDTSKGTLIGTTTATTLQVDDSGAGAPDQSVAGQAFWYTVRAVDNAWAGGNLSGHSAPAFGVIRDRTGPASVTAPAGGFVTVVALKPSVLPSPVVNSAVPAVTQKNGASQRTLICLFNKATGLDWAEFITSAGTVLGRVQFRKDGPSSMRAVLKYERDKTTSAQAGDNQEIVACRVGTRTGRVSNTVLSPPITTPSAGLGVSVTWEARLTRTLLPTTTPDGLRHDRDGEGGVTENITGQLIPSADTREIRLYRRVDNGELTLIEQTTFPAGTAAVDWEDDQMPAGSARVCYYSQALDKNGNPSAMTLLGCVQSESSVNMPTPTLLPLEASGSSSSPTMTVKWFCSPYGITRFELYLSADNERYSTAAPITSLSQDLATGNHPQYPNGYDGMDCSIHETPNVIALSLTNNTYSYTLPVSLGVKYSVLVRAVGAGDYDERSASAFSNLGELEWTSAATVAGIDVPWPARETVSGSAATGFHSDIKAITLPAGLVQGWQGVGIRVGMLDLPSAETAVMVDVNGTGDAFPIPNATPLPQNVSRYQLTGHIDPLAQLYKNNNVATSESSRGTAAGIVFPVVVYRYQVANAAKPTVSNDVVQVTPLMEQIAIQHTSKMGTDYTLVHDPFVCIAPQTSLVPADPGTHDIYLLDRQPVMRGATYRYVIVRLNDSTKEIDRVLTTNDVTIP